MLKLQLLLAYVYKQVVKLINGDIRHNAALLLLAIVLGFVSQNYD